MPDLPASRGDAAGAVPRNGVGSDLGTCDQKGTIFDIQRYSIHDGPGIRTTVFLKGCPLRCPWCANPESQRFAPEVEYFRDRCLRCFRCAAVCPRAAIVQLDGERGLDRTACDACGKCSEVCLADALRIVGREITVGEVVNVLEKDRLFYARTGGGMTLSGGEPAAQPEFAVALLRSCRSRGLHTAIQTAACQSWQLLGPVVREADLVMLDLKVLDGALHKQLVGVPNDLILANAKRIVESKGRAVVVRIPLIPGYSSSLTNVQGIVDFASRLGVAEVHLLPYHRLGEPKYERLGRPYPSLGQAGFQHEYCRALLDQLDPRDVAIVIGG